jgi:hypothetical protein
MQETSSHQERPRRARGIKSLSPSAIVVAVSLLVGGAGFADAATGGNFILGKANKESATASLSDSKGTPLALSAPAGKAPLAVNRNVMVSNLNAQYVGGLTANGLATGGEGFTMPETNAPINNSLTVVASTGPLAAGTYYVTATAFISVASGDSYAECSIVKDSDTSHPYSYGGAQQTGLIQAAETAAVTVVTGDTLKEVCNTGGTNGSLADDAGILAIRVLSSSHN